MLKKIISLLVVGLWACTGDAATDELHEKRQSHQLKIETKPLSPSFEAWEGAVGDRYPKYFVGRQDINLSLIEWLRVQAQTRGDQIFFEKNKTSLQQHAVQIVRKFAPDLELPSDISLAEIYYASMVQAFKMKPPSELERTIFDHLPANSTYRGLQELASAGEIFPFRRPLIDLVNHPMITKKVAFTLTESPETDFFQKQDWETYYSSSVHSDDLFDEAGELLPLSLPYPTNPGELGLALLVRAFMKDVYPIGLSQEDAWVHGTKLTPGSLAWHDDFHGKASKHGRRFVPWVMRVLSKAPEQNVSANELLRRAGPYFQKQYGLVMGIYDYLYQQTTGLLMQGHQEDYKAMLVAFFLGLHEYPSFSEKMYESHDSVAVLHDHLGRVRSTLKATLSSDEIGTDYRTGETSLSDEEIRKAFLPQIINEITKKKGSGVFEDYDTKTGSWRFSLAKAVEYLNANVHDIKVQKTPYAVDVLVELNSGEKFVVGAVTNNVTLMLNDDYRKLLNFLGHRISKPILGEDHQANTLLVKAYYKRLERELSGVLDFFEKRAVAMMDSGIFTTTRDTPNFASRYFRESWDNHQAIEEVLLDLGLERRNIVMHRKSTFSDKFSAVTKAQEESALRKLF